MNTHRPTFITKKHVIIIQHKAQWHTMQRKYAHTE